MTEARKVDVESVTKDSTPPEAKASLPSETSSKALVPAAPARRSRRWRRLVVLLLLAGGAYLILQRSIIAAEGEDSKLAAAVGRDIKGKLSAVMYAASIPLSFVHVFIADAIYVMVALMWLVPDPRLERRMQQEPA